MSKLEDDGLYKFEFRDTYDGWATSWNKETDEVKLRDIEQIQRLSKKRKKELLDATRRIVDRTFKNKEDD